MHIISQDQVHQESFWKIPEFDQEAEIDEPCFEKQISGNNLFKDFTSETIINFGLDSDTLLKLKPKDSESLMQENTLEEQDSPTKEIKLPEAPQVSTSTGENVSSVEVNKKLTVPSKAAKKAKTTEFAYLLERKAFRIMRKYYKDQFEFSID